MNTTLVFVYLFFWKKILVQTICVFILLQKASAFLRT